MTEMAVLGFRVPGGRETRAKASALRQEARRLKVDSHVIDVSADEVELWLVDPTDEQVAAMEAGVKGVEFTGLVALEDSRAQRSALQKETMARRLKELRALRLERGWLSPEAEAIDAWWSDV